MPLLESPLSQLIFAFAMIGLFGFILRWTFSREVRERHALPDDGHSPLGAGISATPADASTAGSTTAAIPAIPDDYGLLVTAATVDSVEQASRVRALLRQAGIRATVTVGSDGRHRMLVFSRDLHRARRVDWLLQLTASTACAQRSVLGYVSSKVGSGGASTRSTVAPSAHRSSTKFG